MKPIPICNIYGNQENETYEDPLKLDAEDEDIQQEFSIPY